MNVGGRRVTGNTESTALDLSTRTQIEYVTWRHSLELSVYQAEEDGNVIVDRYRVAGRSDYKFSERTCLFVRGSFDRQRFGAFDRRLSTSVGVGRCFIEMEGVTLDLGVGVGRLATEPAKSDRIERESIVRTQGDFAWQFSASGNLIQSLEVESGESNTFTRSVTALKSRLVGALAWRISHTVEHNSDVPAGVENTDTLTSVGLSYSF